MKSAICLLILVPYFVVVPCNSEVFTAMSDMSHLIKTESELIRTVDNYIIAQEQRLVRIKQ